MTSKLVTLLLVVSALALLLTPSPVSPICYLSIPVYVNEVFNKKTTLESPKALPPPVAKTILRWILTDPDYVNRFALLLIREIKPATWVPPAVLVKARVGGRRSKAPHHPYPQPSSSAAVRTLRGISRCVRADA